MATGFDPFRDFDSFFGNMRQAPASPAMPLDLYRKGDEFVAAIDLPGVDLDTVDIDVEDRTLTVRAERKAPEGDDIEWLTHERPSGTFARQLTVGYGVALERIKADYEDGVLRLTIPVAEEAKPRKIQVNRVGNQKTIDAD